MLFNTSNVQVLPFRIYGTIFKKKLLKWW